MEGLSLHILVGFGHVTILTNGKFINMTLEKAWICLYGRTPLFALLPMLRETYSTGWPTYLRRMGDTWDRPEPSLQPGVMLSHTEAKSAIRSQLTDTWVRYSERCLGWSSTQHCHGTSWLLPRVHTYLLPQPNLRATFSCHFLQLLLFRSRPLSSGLSHHSLSVLFLKHSTAYLSPAFYVVFQLYFPN